MSSRLDYKFCYSEERKFDFSEKRKFDFIFYENLYILDVDECVDFLCGDGVFCINVEGFYFCCCLFGWSG